MCERRISNNPLYALYFMAMYIYIYNINISIHVHTYIYIYIHIYTYIYMCMYVYIYISYHIMTKIEVLIDWLSDFDMLKRMNTTTRLEPLAIAGHRKRSLLVVMAIAAIAYAAASTAGSAGIFSQATAFAVAAVAVLNIMRSSEGFQECNVEACVFSTIIHIHAHGITSLSQMKVLSIVASFWWRCNWYEGWLKMIEQPSLRCSHERCVDCWTSVWIQGTSCFLWLGLSLYNFVITCQWYSARCSCPWLLQMALI